MVAKVSWSRRVKDGGQAVFPMNRPAGVTAIAVLLLAAAVVATVTGLSLVWPGTFLDRLWVFGPAAYKGFTIMGSLSGFLLLVIAAAAGLSGVGLLRRSQWGWRLTVALLAVNGAVDAVHLFASGRLKSLAGLLIVAGVLIYLRQPEVRSAFEESSR